jgi:hypothetical protein
MYIWIPAHSGVQKSRSSGFHAPENEFLNSLLGQIRHSEIPRIIAPVLPLGPFQGAFPDVSGLFKSFHWEPNQMLFVTTLCERLGEKTQ